MAVTEQVPPVTAAQAFQHYAALYVKYVQIFRKLEAAYDNMVHPQKRMDVKGVLELVQVCVCVEEGGFSELSPGATWGIASCTTKIKLLSSARRRRVS